MKAAIKIFIITMASWLLSSCQAYRAKICRTCATHESTTVMMHDTTVVRDTTVLLNYIKGPVTYLQAPCDSFGQLKPVSITKRKNGLKTTVISRGNGLEVECDADSLRARISYLEHRRREVTLKTVEVPTCSLEHLTKWDSFWIITGRILLSIFILWLVWRLLRAYLKAYLPFLK